MKFVMEVNNRVVVFNTKRAKLLYTNKNNPLIRYFEQGGYYFRTAWYRGSITKCMVFDSQNSCILNMANEAGVNITIKVFKLKEVDNLEVKEDPPQYTGQRKLGI